MRNTKSYLRAVEHQRGDGSRRLAVILPLVTLLFLSLFANAQCVPNCLFYGGDFESNNNDANLAPNENDAIVNGYPYGSATFQNFVVPTGHTWNIGGLFTNNLSNQHPTSAYYEIRSGVSEGNGGTPIISGFASMGAGTFTWTPTGRNFLHHYDEFTAQVSGLNLTLPEGMYWESVVPQALDDYSRAGNSNTFSRPNGVGIQVSDQQFIDSPFFGANFINADEIGAFPTLSSGIEGIDTPEPSSLILLASGVLGVAGMAGRKLVG